MRNLLFLSIVVLPLTCAAAEMTAAFLDAVSHRDVPAVRRMLAADPSLANAKRPNGRSAVTLALFAIAKGEESFHDPASNEILQTILAQEPELDIYETAALGKEQVLAAMLREDPGAVHRKTSYGWTALHLAAFAGNVATTDLLIRSGADVNARASSKFLNTPLQAALLSGQYATAKLLIEHGADVHVRQAGGFAPLHEAASLGRTDLVQLLLDHGAEVNVVANNGLTPLGAALRAHRENTAEQLRAKGAKLEPVRDEESGPARAYVVVEGEVKPIVDTLAPFHYEFLTRGSKTISLEGDAPENITVIAFDNAGEARTWYDAMRPVRPNAATSRMYIVEGK